MGHANNASYLGWAQAAVIDHWTRHAPASAIAALRWVALTHQTTYQRPAFSGQQLVATVLLERVTGARASYETVVRRGEDVLATIRSCWCCADAETLRPVRLSRELIGLFEADG